MNTCLHCRTATDNAKHCSRSCANRINGHLYPSRKRLLRNCKHCGTELHTRRTTCDACNPSFVDWQTVTLQQLRTKVLQQYATQIRSLARIAYRKSSRANVCAVCGYDVHYEVCYIKPISEFQLTDFIADVNQLNNLAALCSNRHWEFDQKLLSPNL